MTPVAREHLALVALAAIAACSIEGRSADFECQGQADCPDGRTCESGWCVLAGGGGVIDGGGGVIDAGGGAIDGGGGGSVDAAPAVCPDAVCDLCDNGTCVFFCTGGSSCQLPVECPPGVPCRVVCTGVESCAGGVDCSAASACTIACGKNDACAGPIQCGPGPCDVGCTARRTCLSGIDCSDSCACTTNCSGADSCGLGPECPDAQCVATDGDCTGGAGCDVCSI